MDDRQNTSYIFIPVSMKQPSDFAALSSALSNSSSWIEINDEIVYMLKYVTDKISGKERQCIHYRFDNQCREQKGMAADSIWYTTREHHHLAQNVAFRFRIIDTELFCFSTGISILAFRINFAESDPMWVSCAQYYLKKVSRERICPEADGHRETTFLDLAKRILSEFDAITHLTYFYYANPSTERANFLTYLEVPPQADYKKELYYLRRCYHDGFSYVRDEEAEQKEIYSSSTVVVWGLSPEAAVCLACPEYDTDDFLQDRFRPNFNAQYLFMYVLLLHQKYMLYYFQTYIGTYDNLKMLEKYQKQLYEFETDFVYSCVTEVPQYQGLYTRMMEAFSLKTMFDDVHEPLISLSELRQKKRDDTVNLALFMISLLSIFSALTDAGFFELLPDEYVQTAQSICTNLVFVFITIFVVINLFNLKKNR